MSQPPHNGAGKPPPPPPPDIPAEPGQRPTVKVPTVSLGPRPASPPSGARPSSAGVPTVPSTGAASGTRPAVGMPPNDPSLRPTARVPTLSAAPASPPPPPVGSVPAASRPGSSPLSSAAIPAVPSTRRPGATPLSSAAIPVVPVSPRPGGTPLSSAAIPVVPPPPPGSGRPVSGVGMARPPPPPPGALQPPPPPAMPSIAPLVPAVAPVVPATAPPPAAPSNPMAELAERCARLDQMDYFEILRVERTASPADIKKAFYRESRAYHPDRFFQLQDKEVKERVNELYKRVTEAYYVLRDDAKRRQYTADVSGPERAHKLRFTEASESETRAASKRQVEEQIGTNPKGRQFYQTGAADADAGRWASAERNLKMALTYEPANTRYKEKLAEVQKVLLEESRKQGGDGFKIR
ncbi:J domain-containing protein [Cystobacter ferrugineus]|nr:DnaJ domain-containing protein [Cystobacter ferrugineus]